MDRDFGEQAAPHWYKQAMNDDRARAPRYARQTAFPPIGIEGQRRLLESRVVVVGAGALGASIGEQLARSGIGFIRILDRDILEESNLGRQSLYTADDVRRRMPKAAALASHLKEFNPQIEIEARVADLAPDNVTDHFADAHLIIDGADNLETRYLINDFAVRGGTPWIYGGCVGSRGLTATVLPGVTPCLRCLFPEAPPAGTVETCETSGIIAPAATLIASLEVAEALKVLVGTTDRVRRGWLSVDLWSFRIVELGADTTPDPECPCCGRREFPHLDGVNRSRAVTFCGRDSVQIVPAKRAPVELAQFEMRWRALGAVDRNEFLVVLTLPEHAITLFADGRALIRGTRDPGIARSIFDRYVGS